MDAAEAARVIAHEHTLQTFPLSPNLREESEERARGAVQALLHHHAVIAEGDDLTLGLKLVDETIAQLTRLLAPKKQPVPAMEHRYIIATALAAVVKAHTQEVPNDQ